ncbi:MAG TPA: alpha/beta hydrolase [Caulobacteraceae bacterium]|jgi:pimeloyl-ACP methyl ester carboxylesterase|nr:alpha/beta hydrolase [Caulobacteraceae bacterium]
MRFAVARMAAVQATKFQTSMGAVPVWGRLESFSPDRPLLFVIRGAWPPTVGYMDPLADLIPEADVALVHLPGMHSTPFRDQTVKAFATAFDEVIAKLAHPRVLVLAISIGGVVALSLTGAWETILVETPLMTAPLWPIHPRFRDIVGDNPNAAEWVRNLFGTGQDGVENRDYRSLALDFRGQGTLLLGDDPLWPERPITRIPSLVCDDSRKAYAANPRFRSVIVPNAGHNIPKDGSGHILHLLHDTLPWRERGTPMRGSLSSEKPHGAGKEICSIP